MWGWNTSTLFPAEHPPFVPVRQKACGPKFGTKNTPDLAPQTGAASRVARYVEHSSIETPPVTLASGRR